MGMIRLVSLLPVRNIVKFKKNGKIFQHFDILDQVQVLSFMDKLFTYLEDIQEKVKEIGLYNHTKMEIKAGSNFLIDYIKEYKVF